MKTGAPTIVGAGLAGLIAAHAWPGAPVLEAAPSPAPLHKALLRFRTAAVAERTGIAFKSVQVRKGLWSEGAFRAPDIRLANLYARKVLGAAGLGSAERSIWNLDPVHRFIAPDNFYERMLDQVGKRVHWGAKVNFGKAGPRPNGDIISTAPLPVVLESLGLAIAPNTFQRAPITVERWHVPGADLYQTIYFPDESTALYRASITGSTLILEFAGGPGETWSVNDTALAAQAFGLDPMSLDLTETISQKYGKIREVDPFTRKQLLFSLTHEHSIYSLGRFATWRNILLDDVVTDIAVIKNLMASGAAYDLRRSVA